MKINVYDIEGQIKKEIDLPEVFQKEIRTDIVKKAVRVSRANRRQPYGASKTAGIRHSAHYIGKGHGMSRIPRLANQRGAFAPGTVSGRRAHPPKPEKNLILKINKKEKKIAFISALSATANKNLVTKRGHKFNENITLPIIVEDSFETLKKTKDVIKVFQKIGIYEDIERAKNGKHLRAGKGKLRGRKYKIPKSVLLIVSGSEIIKSARNIIGIDTVRINNFGVEVLAPGGDVGRLTMFTEKAFEEVIQYAKR